MTGTLGEKIRLAGKAVIAAPADQVGTILAAQLQQLVTPPYRIETAAIADHVGRTTESFPVLICNGGQIIGPTGSQAVVPTESVAVAFEVSHTVDLDGLAAAYGRLAQAKAQVKSAPVPGGEHIERTLGIIFAADSSVPLEELGEEVIRLNARTPSDRWPDLLVVAKKGQIGYYAQLLGSNNEPGILLPPSQNAGSAKRVPVYATMMISATGAETFNLMAHAILGHLTRWAPGYLIPEYQTILDGVPRQGITLTGYQYNLAGELRPLPREQYRDRAMPLQSVSLVPKGNKNAPPLAGMAFLPWQDGGVVLLQGKLPLEGMLVFLAGVISGEEFRKIQKMTWGDLQVSNVLPISERQYHLLLRNIQQRGGLDVRRNDGKIVVQKFADEGTGTPFVARIFYGQMKLAEGLGATDRESFLKAHKLLMTTAMEIRDAANDVARTWKDYKRRIDEGSIVERQRGQIHVTEHIDRQLGRLTSDFLTGATRSFKDRMQRVSRALGLNIGCLYQEQAKFERGLAELQTSDAPLAAYIRQARAWSHALVTTRNNLDHGDWELPRAIINEVDGRVTVTEPLIEKTPVTQWVADMTDRILCLIEDIVAHGIQKNMPEGVTLTEIPIAQRSPELPLRFQNAVAGGGRPAWEIRYHMTKFDET